MGTGATSLIFGQKKLGHNLDNMRKIWAVTEKVNYIFVTLTASGSVSRGQVTQNRHTAKIVTYIPAVHTNRHTSTCSACGRTDDRTDDRTDGRTASNQYTPPSTSLAGGIKILL